MANHSFQVILKLINYLSFRKFLDHYLISYKMNSIETLDIKDWNFLKSTIPRLWKQDTPL